ncbi:hypothetical protein E4T66_16590 [Sinimarinibacterium sp. CAU 1509]|uniref:hypothetical protein n=1 Tax=Sinimarinibacterium sp. CAU 1509 TaxID=2562283 RepID=UPI0010AC626A|nr:hypothetical protein [Sinimarinibacterium sp. CAU 1509]TJY58308.1 hypothetical protein E4T66_16590 [Sinimarinibacterium sp. CAU 1509]
MRFHASAAIVIVTALMSACSTQGARVEAQTYQQFEAGKTRKQDVIAALGQPSGRQFAGNEEALVYRFTKTNSKSWIPVAGAFLGNSVEVQICTFLFTTSDVLKNKSCSEQSGHSSLLGG